MKRFLLIVLAASLLCACAPKQPKTMEQQTEEARAEASRNNGGTETDNGASSEGKDDSVDVGKELRTIVHSIIVD